MASQSAGRPSIPSCPYKVLGLDLAGTHLPLLRALSNLCDECFLLLLQLDALLVEFSNCLVEEALVLAQTLGGRHPLAEGPFQDLWSSCQRGDTADNGPRASLHSCWRFTLLSIGGGGVIGSKRRQGRLREECW